MVQQFLHTLSSMPLQGGASISSCTRQGMHVGVLELDNSLKGFMIAHVRVQCSTRQNVQGGVCAQ